LERKEVTGEKMVGKKYTWLLRIAFKRTACRACLRMSPECFDTFHDVIASDIQRLDTLIRDAIPSRIKLEIALSYLATGNS
jgi:hypothetical protein